MSEPETFSPAPLPAAPPAAPSAVPPADLPGQQPAPEVPLSATPALNEGAEAADVAQAVATAAAPPDDGAVTDPGVAAALNEGDDGMTGEPPAGEDGAAEPVEPAETAAPAAAADQPAKPAVPDLPPAATAALLAQHFPALFGAGRALPIKLRIQADIQQRAPGIFNKKSLSIFLHRATTSTAYLRALAGAPHRFDLDGAPAGDIADEHRAAATVELDRRRAIVDARRQAERQAQRDGQRTPRGADAGAAAAGVSTEAGSDAGGHASTVAGADGTAPAAQPARPPREPRPPRPARPARPPGSAPQGQRPPQNAGGDRGPRPDRVARDDRPRGPGRPEHGAQGPRPDQAARADRPPRAQRPPASEPQQRPTAAPQPAAAPTIADPAARERAVLLRQFESSPLTLANFGALKGLREAELNAQLDLAWHERQARGGAEPAPSRDTGPAARRPR